MENYDDSGAGIVAAFLGAYFLFILIISLISVIGLWKMFEKAGKPGWAAIIPIYNAIVILEITGQPTWWVIMLFIPVVNLIFIIMILNALSNSFGQGVGTTILFLFFPFIGFPMVGFGSAKYVGPVGQVKV